MEARTVKTRQQVREEFLRRGQSIGAWADRNGFDRTTVNQVLTGRNKATRGTGHAIAVKLGLKDGEIVGEGGHEDA